MSEKVVVDTNILIYSLDSQSKHYKHSWKILTGDYSVYVTSKSITEFCSVLSKNPNFPYAKVLEEFDNVCKSFPILYPSSESIKLFRQLSARYQPIGNRVYDIEIVSIALSHQIEAIATLNKSDFQNINEIRLL